MAFFTRLHTLPLELQSCSSFRPNWVIVPFQALPSFQNNPTAPLIPNGFCDSLPQLFPVDVTSLLEFIFYLCLLAFSPLMSMKDLVPGIKFLLQLNQAKSLTPTEYGDNPLNDLHFFLSLWSSMSAGDVCHYRLKWHSSFLAPSYPWKWCLPYLCTPPWDVF